MIECDNVEQFIKNELIPKYDELESCTVHRLPGEVIGMDIECIFRIPFYLVQDDRFSLTKSILNCLTAVFGDDAHKILIVLSEF